MTAPQIRSYLLAGIGNAPMPFTRHSVGHLLVSSLATRFGLTLRPPGGRGGAGVNCLCAETTVRMLEGTAEAQDVRVVLANSQALMNLSGPAVVAALRHHFRPPLPPKLVLLHDSIEHAPQSITPKARGSAKGHNGVQSVKVSLKTDDFWRMRLGVGADESAAALNNRNKRKAGMAEWVLGPLTGGERRFWGAGGEGAEEVWEKMEWVLRQDIRNEAKWAEKEKVRRAEESKYREEKRAYDEFQEKHGRNETIVSSYGLRLPR